MQTVLVLLIAAAEAKELHSGEFRNTADTTEPGEVVLHPLFMRSSAGLAKNLDLKFPGILGLAAGPMLGFEYAVVSNDSLALSVEPQGRIGWTFADYSAGGSARFTKRLGDHQLNVSAGATYTKYPTLSAPTPPSTPGTSVPTTTTTGIPAPTIPTPSVELSRVSVPINVGFDIVASDYTRYRLAAQTDVADATNGFPFSSFAANWNHGAKDGSFRVALGAAVLVGPNPIPTMLSSMPDELTSLLPDLLTNDLLILPAPTFEMWWKI